MCKFTAKQFVSCSLPGAEKRQDEHSPGNALVVLAEKACRICGPLLLEATDLARTLALVSCNTYIRRLTIRRWRTYTCHPRKEKRRTLLGGRCENDLSITPELLDGAREAHWSSTSSCGDSR
jgi:hypothetical protein